MISIETLRFSNNATLALTYGSPGTLEPTGKTAGEDFGGPLVSSLMDDPEVLPFADDAFLLSKDADAPQVLPGVFDDGLTFEPLTLAEWRMQTYGQAWLSRDAHPLSVQSPDSLFIRPEQIADLDPFNGSDPWA